MAVFKLTNQEGALLSGGATREAGLKNLDSLSSQHSKTLLEGLRTNLLGSDGNAKHGVLKLRNSSKEGRQMEFARMRGMDRWFSKESAFRNTAAALEKLMVQSGAKPETAKALIQQYCAKDGSIKCKDAIQLINRVLPQSTQGATVAETLQRAGVEAPDEALQDKIDLSKEENLEQGGIGKVFQATDHGAPCILKRFGEPIEISLDQSGIIKRGALMDANHLAAANVPGTIAPNRYIIAKTDPGGGKAFHTVTAGRNFKEFCKQNKGSKLALHGIVMDKAKGARMDQVNSSSSDQKEIARGFAAILMNASSRGVVFYDIKRENAFVDGGKLTLIDTDGAFKNSKTAVKNPDKQKIALTFKVPTKDDSSKDSPHRGLQQDLWSVGFTLLEHAGRGEGNLMDAGHLRGRDPYQFWLRMDTPEARFAWLKEKIGGPEPRAGSVEDFALLCIKTALGEPHAPYFKRFTGEGEHLLDPILAHPLIGGREAFIQRHFARKDPLQATSVANKNAPEQLLRPIEEEDSIDHDDIEVEDNKNKYMSVIERKKSDDEDDSSSSSSENNSIKSENFFRKFISNQMKEQSTENDN